MRSPRPLRALALLGALLLAASSAAAVDLIGTWHVLEHYKDSSTNHPERERWNDRIWVFSMEGSRLKWSEYPIVVFRDQSGRFEPGSGSRLSRVLEFWEPNGAQRAQIREGLEINPRGQRTKSLRGSAETGWNSAKKKSGYQSARFITFEETWTIEDPGGLPIFKLLDSMGSASTETAEGHTLYEATEVDPNGRSIVGKFDRDGTRIGTFRLSRSGKASTVKGSGKDQNERLMDTFYRTMGKEFGYDMARGEVSEETLRNAIDAGQFTEDMRTELRVGVEAAIAKEYQDQGNDPRNFRPQIQSLARKMTVLFVDGGKSWDEIGEMVASGKLRP